LKDGKKGSWTIEGEIGISVKGDLTIERDIKNESGFATTLTEKSASFFLVEIKPLTSCSKKITTVKTKRLFTEWRWERLNRLREKDSRPYPNFLRLN